ncbi:MAG: PEP-CTERM sorting domain-containing protein [Pirellulales bacterium]|nr:PEP-CTERM sorting domain-containing protein [Pirellulales bacterium]
MRYKTIAILVLGALLAAPQFAVAYSFQGDDWLLNLEGTLHIDSIITADEPISMVDEPITITQSSTTDIVIPLVLPDPINETFYVPGTVSGTVVTAHETQDEFGPITYNYEGTDFTFLLRDIEAHLVGDVTGINASVVDEYGERAYEITGRPSTESYLITDIYMDFGLGWVWVGDADLEIDSWSASRGEVPEPGSLLMLFGLAAGLAGYGCVRRR